MIIYKTTITSFTVLKYLVFQLVLFNCVLQFINLSLLFFNCLNQYWNNT